MAKKEFTQLDKVKIIDMRFGPDQVKDSLEDAVHEALADNMIVTKIVKEGGYMFVYFGYEV